MSALSEVNIEDLLNQGLPKWPQMIVTGPRIKEDLALEVIRRTDVWFMSAHCCNYLDDALLLAKRLRMPHFHAPSQHSEPFDWRAHAESCSRWKKTWGVVETSSVRNAWIGSSFRPHGWCHPDGRLHYTDNVGKWPSIESIYIEWQASARHGFSVPDTDHNPNEW